MNWWWRPRRSSNRPWAIRSPFPIRSRSGLARSPGLRPPGRLRAPPADCVKLALEELLDWTPDLVVSGINRGLNVGLDILYSGTVSAATEAAFNNPAGDGLFPGQLRLRGRLRPGRGHGRGYGRSGRREGAYPRSGSERQLPLPARLEPGAGPGDPPGHGGSSGVLPGPAGPLGAGIIIGGLGARARPSSEPGPTRPSWPRG